MSGLKTSDIKSYTVFANIDDRNGTVKGHMIILSKEQIETIEDIILSAMVKVKAEHTYEIE